MRKSAMKLLVIYLIIAVFQTTQIYAQKNNPYNPEKKFTMNQLKEDFLTMRESLEKIHVALYEYTDKKTFDQKFDSTNHLIKSKMTEIEFFRIISSVVSNVHCGHTYVYFSDNFMKYMNSEAKYLPVKIKFIGEKAYILENYTEDLSIKRGMEVLTINSVPTSVILDYFIKRMPSDGFNQTRKLWQMNNRPVHYISGTFFDFPESYRIQCKIGDDGEPALFTVQALSGVEINRVANEKYPADKTPYRYEIIDNLQTAVLTIRSFVNQEDNDYYKFLITFFNEIQKQKIENLILDFRGNSGGHPDYSVDLLKYLMDREFIYFSKEVGNELCNPIKPHELTFTGNKYFLIDGGCFSTTGHFLSLVKYHKLGLLIGEESGGTFTCNDSSYRIPLPNTKLVVRIPNRTFPTAVTGFKKGRGIIPDLVVKQQLEDVLSGEDTVLDYTLNLIKREINN